MDSELISLENEVLNLRFIALSEEANNLGLRLNECLHTIAYLEQRVSYLEDRASRAEVSCSSTISSIRLRFSSELNDLNNQLALASSKTLDLSEKLSILGVYRDKYLLLRHQLLNPLVVISFLWSSVWFMLKRYSLIKTR